jgi:hypothetical protein
LKFDNPNLVLSVRDAAYHTVHDYPGGATALGLRLAMSGMLLSHQVNPNNLGKYSLGLEKAVEVQMMAQDYRILHAMARELGHVAVQFDQVHEDNVMGSIADTVKEFSGYLTAITDSVRDSKVTDNELKEIDEHLGLMVQQANQLRAAVAAMNSKLHQQERVQEGIKAVLKARLAAQRG